MSDSLQPHGLQHARLPCPPLSSRVCSNSSPLSSWCCLTISFSVALFSFCLQFFPASGSFPMSHLHTRCQNYWSFSFSISPFDEYLGLISFRIDWFDLLAGFNSKGLSRVFSSTTTQKHQFFYPQPSLWSNSHIHNDYSKNHSFDHMDLCWQSGVSAF